MVADAISLRDERIEDIGQIIDPNDNLHRKRLSRIARRETLLQPICQAGQVLQDQPALSAIQTRVKEQLKALDDSHQRFEFPHIYPVGLSPQLNQLRDDMIQRERDRLVDGG